MFFNRFTPHDPDGKQPSSWHFPEDILPKNVDPPLQFPPPRAERYTAQVLSADQAQQFLHALQGHRMDALFRLALGLGMRQGELLGARWQDTDLDRGTLTVRVSLQTVGGRFVLAPPKTARSTRTLPLTPSLVAVLRGHRARQLAQRVKIGPAWQNWDLVFASEVGTLLDPRTVRDALRDTLTRAQLPPMRFHDLRA